MKPETISGLVEGIYDAALDSTLWPGIVERCCRFVGGSAGNLFFNDTGKSPKGAFFTWGHDRAYQQLYNTEYTKLNPFSPALGFHAPGSVVSQADLVPDGELKKTRFFREWMRPQGIVDVLFGILEKSASSFGLLAVRRYQRDGFVDDDARHRMGLIVPHLRRAVSIANCMAFHQGRAAALEETLNGLSTGVLLVGSNASIRFANAKAKELLAEKKVLRGGQGTLAATCPLANRRLQGILQDAAEGDLRIGGKGIAMPLPGAEGDGSIAHILPLMSGTRQERALNSSAVAAIFVREPSLNGISSLETVARLYGLTASEARVLQALAELDGIPACAERLGISRTTVKTHLRNIFLKTGVNRQADLIKLVASTTSPLRKVHSRVNGIEQV